VTGVRARPREGAVLLPLYRDAGGEARLVVVRRTEGGLHGGQLAFPGGGIEPGDASPLAAALREAEEEIGLPRAGVEVLAALPAVSTQVSGWRVTPFLARVTPPPAWRPQADEVAEVLEPRLADLVHPVNQGEVMERFPQWPDPVRIAFYRVGPHRLWGLSYRILHPVLPRLLAGEWPL
jgi:8-oxo-dGTP pyrophosphatase MutT (NUDIX family)